MKGTTLRFIIMVIIPSIILIGVGIYFIFQIPQVRWGIQKHITNYMIDRNVRQGKISQESAIQLKRAFNRIFEVTIKLENSNLDRGKIEEEIEAWAMSHQYSGPRFGMAKNDNEAKELIDLINGIAQIIEKILENSAGDTE